MKKFISFIAAVAMMTSMIVSVSAAESKMTITTTPTKLTNETYAELTKEATIPSGFEAYKVVVSASDFGTLNCVANEFTGDIEGGRRLGNLVWSIDFGNASFYNGSTGEIYKNKSKSINSEMQAAISATEGTWDQSASKLSKLTYTFGASYATAYPATSSSLTKIDNVVTIVVVIKEGTSVTGTVTAMAKIKEYPSENDEGELSASTGTITLSPATITLGAAPEKDDKVTAETDSNGVTTITYGSEYTGSKALEGKQIVVKTLADTDTITKETRFNVTFGDETKPYGGTLWDHLDLEGKGALAVNKLTIAIAFDAGVENVTAANVTVALVK